MNFGKPSRLKTAGIWTLGLSVGLTCMLSPCIWLMWFVDLGENRDYHAMEFVPDMGQKIALNGREVAVTPLTHEEYFGDMDHDKFESTLLLELPKDMLLPSWEKWACVATEEFFTQDLVPIVSEDSHVPLAIRGEGKDGDRFTLRQDVLVVREIWCELKPNLPSPHRGVFTDLKWNGPAAGEDVGVLRGTCSIPGSRLGIPDGETIYASLNGGNWTVVNADTLPVVVRNQSPENLRVRFIWVVRRYPISIRGSLRQFVERW